MSENLDFLIVGTGRSGTTLARTVIDSHSSISIPGETGFLPRLIKLNRLWWRGDRIDVKRFVKLAMANGRLARSGINKDNLAASLTKQPPAKPAEAIARIYQVYSNGSSPSLYGDKTPGYIRHLPILCSWFPDVRVIRMVRHPLAVVASLMEQPWAPNDSTACALIWAQDQKAFLAARLPDTLTVKLEDLIADRTAVCEGVCSYLDVPYEPTMLSYQSKAASVMDQNVHPKSHRGLNSKLSNLRDWSTTLSKTEAESVWSIVGQDAIKLGYTVPDACRQHADDSRAMKRARRKLRQFYWTRRWRSLKTLANLVRT